MTRVVNIISTLVHDKDFRNSGMLVTDEIYFFIRGGNTSMAGMAIAIPGVLNISKTGDTMGKIR